MWEGQGPSRTPGSGLYASAALQATSPATSTAYPTPPTVCKWFVDSQPDCELCPQWSSRWLSLFSRGWKAHCFKGKKNVSCQHLSSHRFKGFIEHLLTVCQPSYCVPALLLDFRDVALVTVLFFFGAQNSALAGQRTRH